MRHIVSILMANEAGALVRVAGMFSQRGFNIETLNVAPTENPSVSRLTLVTEGTEQVMVQINRQLHKLVDVVEVRDMTSDSHVERELALFKVYADGKEGRDNVARIVQEYHAEIVNRDEGMDAVQFIGTAREVNAFVDELTQAGQLEEEVRSGVLAISSGAQKLHFNHTDDASDAASF